MASCRNVHACNLFPKLCRGSWLAASLPAITAARAGGADRGRAVLAEAALTWSEWPLGPLALALGASAARASLTICARCAAAIAAPVAVPRSVAGVGSHGFCAGVEEGSASNSCRQRCLGEGEGDAPERLLRAALLRGVCGDAEAVALSQASSMKRCSGCLVAGVW